MYVDRIKIRWEKKNLLTLSHIYPESLWDQQCKKLRLKFPKCKTEEGSAKFQSIEYSI